GGGPGPAAGLGGPAGRAAPRGLRDPAAARRPRPPAPLPLPVGRGGGRAGPPDGVQPAPGGPPRPRPAGPPTPAPRPRPRSDPAAPGLECAPFVIAHASGRQSSVFDNGLPLAPTEWIQRGELAALAQTRHSAALSGLAVTPAISNLILEVGGAAASLDDMI